jgi:hypothetical protein
MKALSRDIDCLPLSSSHVEAVTICEHDAAIAALLRAMRELIGPAKTPSRGIGFLADIK